MTEPNHSGDPTAVILARVEVKLDNALTEQARHSTQIDRHGARLDDHGNRLTALEAVAINDKQRDGFDWTRLAVLVAFLGVIAALITPFLGR